eukprot:2461027-Amphidinium_carterae.1
MVGSLLNDTEKSVENDCQRLTKTPKAFKKARIPTRSSAVWGRGRKKTMFICHLRVVTCAIDVVWIHPLFVALLPV